VEDVGAALVKQAGEAGDQSLAVRAVNEQNSGIFHALFRLSHPGLGLRRSMVRGYEEKIRMIRAIAHASIWREGLRPQKKRRGNGRPGDARATQ
jgi:hypothetical protein